MDSFKLKFLASVDKYVTCNLGICTILEFAQSWNCAAHSQIPNNV